MDEVRIVKIGHLFQVRKEGIGNVYQSHDIRECEMFLRTHNVRILASELKESRITNIRYGRICNW